MNAVEQALGYARDARTQCDEPSLPDQQIIALADEVERLRASVARVRQVCTADRRIRWDDGSYSVSVLDPADILRALDGDG